METFWQNLVEQDKSGHMITAGSFTGTGSDQDLNEWGLPYNHAFSIMHVFTVQDDKLGETRLVQLRNPWGTETFRGDWSDESELWTEDLLRQANHTLHSETNNDGKFHMSFADYMRQLEYTDFSLDVAKMHHSGFLVQGDDALKVPREELFGDGFVYNEHLLHVRSNVTQTVHISAHSYSYKHYHGAC